MQRGAFSLAGVSTFPITACRTLTPLNFHPPAHSRRANTYPKIVLPDCCAVKFVRGFQGTESSGLRVCASPEHLVMMLLVGVSPKLCPHEFVSGIVTQTNSHGSIPSEFAPFARSAGPWIDCQGSLRTVRQDSGGHSQGWQRRAS